MQTARCPACNSDVMIEESAYVGDLVDCVNCGVQLDIASLHPPQVVMTGGEPQENFDHEDYGGNKNGEEAEEEEEE